MSPASSKAVDYIFIHRAKQLLVFCTKFIKIAISKNVINLSFYSKYVLALSYLSINATAIGYYSINVVSYHTSTKYNYYKVPFWRHCSLNVAIGSVWISGFRDMKGSGLHPTQKASVWSWYWQCWQLATHWPWILTSRNLTTKYKVSRFIQFSHWPTIQLEVDDINKLKGVCPISNAH